MATTSRTPKWIKPQLTRLVDEAPAGAGWVHGIKYDGYRMHARIDGGKTTLLTLRQVSYQGQREDKPARQGVRPVPHEGRGR